MRVAFESCGACYGARVEADAGQLLKRFVDSVERHAVN